MPDKLQCVSISKFRTVVIGKNGYLYDKGYIEGYTGKDFIGKGRIDLQIEKAKVVQTELKKKNIDLLFVFAPGKGSYFPEYIPDGLNTIASLDSTNFTCYINAISKTNLNYIDLRTYLISLKNKTPYPIYSQMGVHWGNYACYLAMDTICKKIEQIKNISLTKFKINKIELRDTLQRTDKDEGDLVNVFTTLPFYKMAYLTIEYSRNATTVKPNLLAVSDSYFSNIVSTNMVDSVFEGWSYWNYNEGDSSDKKDKTFHLKKEIEKRDVILLMATDGGLGMFPFDFINETYELYAPRNKEYHDLKQREFRAYMYGVLLNIEKTKDWKKQLVGSAKLNGTLEIDEFIKAGWWCWSEQERKLNEKIKN